MFSDPSNIDNICLTLSLMSVTNVKWSCLYSGAGITYANNEAQSRADSTLEQSPIYLQCIYKKAKPTYSIPPESQGELGKSSWISSSFSKIISPDTQAMAILSMCSSAKAVYANDISLGKSLIYNAQIYRDFSCTYMRNCDGLYVSMEDKTKPAENELKLKPCSKHGKLSDQVLMHEAFVYLYKITSDDSMEEYKSESCEKYKDDALSLYAFIENSLSELLDSSSKALSTCISSLSRCCNITDCPQRKHDIESLICTLCAELDTRIKITGQVETSLNRDHISTMATHFKAACAMLEGYKATGIAKFKEQGIKIYDYLEDLYNSETGLYLTENTTKHTCSIRDIADMLKLLYLKHEADGDIYSYIRLETMYKKAIEDSLIIPSLPQASSDMLGKVIQMPSAIPDSFDTGRAPVFMKSIKLNTKKDSSVTVSRHFCSLYSFYASYTFLSYFYCQAPSQPASPEILEAEASIVAELQDAPTDVEIENITMPITS